MPAIAIGWQLLGAWDAASIWPTGSTGQKTDHRPFTVIMHWSLFYVYAILLQAAR